MDTRMSHYTLRTILTFISNLMSTAQHTHAFLCKGKKKAQGRLKNFKMAIKINTA